MTISNSHASHIQKVNLGFVLSAPNLDPGQVSSKLGIPYDSSSATSDKRFYQGRNSTSAVNEGWWRIDSEPRLTASGIATKDINQHLKILLDILLPKRDLIIELTAQGERYFDVVWKSTYLFAGTGPVIDAVNMEGMGKLRAGLGFDIYHVEEKH